MRKIMIYAEDGYPLGALFGEPEGSPMGTIIISAATGVRKEFYINFSKFLIENGYSVLIYDYRGIGESAPDDIRTSHAFMHEWGTQDMNAVLDYLVNERLTEHPSLVHSIVAQLVGLLTNKDQTKSISLNAALVIVLLAYPITLSSGCGLHGQCAEVIGYGVIKKLDGVQTFPKRLL